MKKIYLLAVIAALITAFATYRFAEMITNQAQNQIEGSKSVVVAVSDIEENTVLTPDMVEIKKISGELVGDGTAQQIEDVTGRIIKYPLSAGEPIYESRLLSVGVDSPNRLSYEIPQGYRAVSVPVDAVTGVANYLKKGDRVDVVAYFINGEELGARRIAFENILVLRTGNETEDDSTASDYTSVTVALTPEQAVDMNYVIANANIRLVLRSPIDK